MSYQVGAACYATLVDAGTAACAAYAPVSQLVQDGAIIRTVSCSGADVSTGALNLNITSTPVDGSAASSVVVQQALAFSDCQEPAWREAGEAIASALLGLWLVIYVGKKIIDTINWGRGEST